MPISSAMMTMMLGFFSCARADGATVMLNRSPIANEIARAIFKLRIVVVPWADVG